MTRQDTAESNQRGTWLVVGALCVAHLLAFGMVYLVLVQMNWAFRDFFALVGAAPTPRFAMVSTVSDYIAAYTPLVLVLIAVDLYIVVRLARRTSRWTSGYSHAVLMTLGFTGFLWTAWAVHVMAWGVPAKPTTPGPARSSSEPLEITAVTNR